MTVQEITSRVNVDDRQSLVAIAAEGSDAAERTYAALAEGAPAGYVIVARWVKPQFSNHRSFPVRGADALSFVVNGVLRGSCTNLRFFFEPEASVPKGDNGGYRALFL